MYAREEQNVSEEVVLIMLTVKVQMLSQKSAGSIPQRRLQLDTDIARLGR